MTSTRCPSFTKLSGHLNFTAESISQSLYEPLIIVQRYLLYGARSKILNIFRRTYLTFLLHELLAELACNQLLRLQ